MPVLVRGGTVSARGKGRAWAEKGSSIPESRRIVFYGTLREPCQRGARGVEGKHLPQKGGKMSKSVIILIVCLIGAASAYSQEDPFDLSAEKKQIAELGVPTISEVKTLEEKAKSLFQSGNYTEAVPALETYARKANWLANLIAAGLKPFYDASYDDRKEFPRSKINILANYESLSNSYKAKRNRAMVMQAECLIKQGNREDATALLVRALDLIGIDQEEWWIRARKSLYDIVQVKQ